MFPAYHGYEIQAYYGHAYNDILEYAAETSIVEIVLLIGIVLLSLSTAFATSTAYNDWLGLYCNDGDLGAEHTQLC